jgi:hypothetical protein
MAGKSQIDRSLNCLHYNFIGYPDLAMAAAIAETDTPSEFTGSKRVTRRGVVAKLNVYSGDLNPWDVLTDLVRAYNLDLNFVLALIGKESGHMWQGHPDLVAAESRGATGVMQLRHWAVEEYRQGAKESESALFPAALPGLVSPDKYDAVHNIQCGLWYLRRIEKWIVEPIVNRKAETLVDLAALAVGYYNPQSAIDSQKSLKKQTFTGMRVEDYWSPILQNYKAFSNAEDNALAFGDSSSPDLERILQESSNKVYNPSAITDTGKQINTDNPNPVFTASRRKNAKQKFDGNSVIVDNKYIRF